MLNRWQSTIVDAQGNVQPLANLTVRNEADQSLAKMWASPGTSQPLPDGMVQADGNGYAFFYARGGLYRITSVELGIDWRHVPLGELAGMDVADLGSAATRDVGTEADEVPANSNLGAAAYLPISSTAQAQSLTSDATVITPKKLGDAMNSHVLGVGQTWQDMTSSRPANTTYTNTTGRAIYVSSRVGSSASPSSSRNFKILVDGVTVCGGSLSPDVSSAYSATVCAIVPSGSTYMLDATEVTVLEWAELRS